MLRAVALLVIALTACAPSSAPLPTTFVSSIPTVSAPPTSATPQPTATALATASPTPSALNRSAILSTSGGSRSLRTEADTTPIRTVPTSSLFAPDSPRFAYWTESAGAQLHVVDASGIDRIIATFADLRPGGIAWSTDGAGLLVSLARPDPQFVIARDLVAVDIATGANRKVYTGIGPSGASVIPLVWRRDTDLYVAYESGPGGFSFGYTVIASGRPPVRTDPDAQAIGFAASKDGTLVMGLWLQDQAIKVWPADDFSKKTELRLAAGEHFSQPRWWPDRTEITFRAGRVAEQLTRDDRIERWDPITGARSVVRRMPDSTNPGAYYVRADGTGILVQGGYPPGGWEVTDLRSGSTSAIPLVPGEVILGTVLIR